MDENKKVVGTMSINEQGQEGEKFARKVLMKYGFYKIFGADWIIKLHNGKYVVIEVKYKSEPFKAPPFDGHGLDLRQVQAREQFRKDTGIRSILLVIDKDSEKVYWNFIDQLEKGENFTTKNQIRIYPLTNFLPEERLEDLHNGNT